MDRFSEPLKFIPVSFVASLVFMLYFIYMNFHAWPMARDFGLWRYAVIFNALTGMLLTCYARCIFTKPGSVPDHSDDPSWTYQPSRSVVQPPPLESADGTLTIQEAKRSGDRRNCKWCSKYKPDRCHHCRVCRTCVLKMDHHCPWIYNCVGFGNHKYFFLLLVYTMCACWFIALTMVGTVRASLDSRTPFLTMFSVLFGETLSAFFGAVSTVFLSFHVWLMFRGMTTIEFCEKSMRRAGYDRHLFDRGAAGNVCAVLGDVWFLWPLPLSPPTGTGLEFVAAEETPLVDQATKDPERCSISRARSLRHPAGEPVTYLGGTGGAPGSDNEHS